MRRFTFGSPLPGPEGFKKYVEDALRAIEQASAADVAAVLDHFSVTGVVTETRTLDVSTATAADIVSFIATLLSDVQKGGQKKSYGS